MAIKPPFGVCAKAVTERSIMRASRTLTGVTSILNFAPTVLTVQDGVDVRKVDLSIELQILAFHEQRKAGEEAEAQAGAAVRTVQESNRQGPDGDVPAVMPA